MFSSCTSIGAAPNERGSESRRAPVSRLDALTGTGTAISRNSSHTQARRANLEPVEALFLVLLVGFFGLLAAWYRTSEALRLLTRKVGRLEANLRASEGTQSPQAPASTPVTPPIEEFESVEGPHAEPTEHEPPPRPSIERAPARGTEQAIDWERWIGLRGAAVVGGIALVFAGVFLVQVAIQRGWLGPAARDSLAFTIGIACLAAHAAIRARGSNYNALADSLGGAGTVLVYGACWAAYSLHGLIGLPIAFTAMTLTTGICFAQSYGARAPVLSVFALVGGFATPLLLDVVEGASLALLAYVVVLNLAGLQLARKRAWTWALPVAACGTLVVAAAWVFGLDETTSFEVVAAVFSLLVTLFAWAPEVPEPRSAKSYGPATQLLAQTAALALVAGPGVWNSSVVNLWPLAGFLAAYLIAARVVRGKAGEHGHLTCASMFSVVALGWLAFVLRFASTKSAIDPIGMEHFGDWSLATSALGILIALLSAPVRALRSPARGGHVAAFWFALLSLGVLAGSLELPRRVDSAPWTVAGIASLLCVIGVIGSGRTRIAAVPAAIIGLVTGFALWVALLPVAMDAVDLGSPVTWTGVALTLVFGLASAIARRRGLDLWTGLRAAALCVALPPAMTCAVGKTETAALVVVAATLAIAAPLIRWHHRHRSVWNVAGIAYALLAVFTISSWLRGHGNLDPSSSFWPAVAFLAFLGSVLPGSLAARANPKNDESDAFTALAANLSFPTLVLAIGGRDALGSRAVQLGLSASSGWYAALTLGASILTCAALVALRVRRAPRVARVFFAFAGVPVAIFVAHATTAQWPAVAVALAGGWMAFVLRRNGVGAPVPQTVVISGCAALALAGLTFFAGAFEVERWFIPLDVTIDYAMTAVGVTTAAIAAKRLPKSRGSRAPLCAFGVAVLLTLAFSWLNAVVINGFSSGGSIRVQLEHSQTRDLALSLAWAAFAGAVLALGLRQRSSALRWVSLCLMIVTIGKVFLYDLQNLEGLARVASLFGLSLALLGVSITYARLLGVGRSPRPDTGVNA